MHGQLGGHSVGEGDIVFVHRHEMTEGGVQHQVVEVLVFAKCGVIGPEDFRVHALVGVLLAVAVVETQSAAQVGMPAAVGLVRRDNAPLGVFFVHAVHLREHVLRFFVLVDHRQVDVADLIAEHTDAGVPVPASCNLAVYISSHAEQVALRFVESSGDVGVRVFFLCPAGIIDRLISVVAVEVT